VVGQNATAPYCYMSGMDVCAKTGTTSDDADRWLCGFTKYYSAATWFGYDKNRESVPYFWRNPAGSIWSNVMKNIHKDKAKVRFTRPNSGVVWGKVCLDSGMIATDLCTRTQSVPYISGTVPSSCNAHTKITICTETGKIANEFCTKKEEKVYLQKPLTEQTSAWVTKYDEGVFDIPTETCAVHTKKQVPMISIVGKKEADAKTALTAIKLAVKIEYAEDKTKDNGIVIKQSVAAGTLVDEGTTITITINKKTLPTATTMPKPTTTTKPTSTNVPKPTATTTPKPATTVTPTVAPTIKPTVGT